LRNGVTCGEMKNETEDRKAGPLLRDVNELEGRCQKTEYATRPRGTFNKASGEAAGRERCRGQVVI